MRKVILSVTMDMETAEKVAEAITFRNPAQHVMTKEEKQAAVEKRVGEFLLASVADHESILAQKAKAKEIMDSGLDIKVAREEVDVPE